MPLRFVLLSRLLLVSCLGVLSIACGEKSKRAELDGGLLSDGAVAPGNSLPGGYVPRIDCGDLGKSCDGQPDCSDDHACIGGNCLPKDTGSCTEGCPKEAPLCVFDTCIGADELGCLCLHPDGRSTFPNCQTITDGAPECIPEDTLCDTDVYGCCRGTSCIQGSDQNGDQLLGVCKKACSDHDNCDSGCCLAVSSLGQKFCADHDACVERCRIQSEECDGDLRPCCDGMLCVASATDPALNGCQPVCMRASDCESGCCVLFTNEHGAPADTGVCAPADRCATP